MVIFKTPVTSTNQFEDECHRYPIDLVLRLIDKIRCATFPIHFTFDCNALQVTTNKQLLDSLPSQVLDTFGIEMKFQFERSFRFPKYLMDIFRSSRRANVLYLGVQCFGNRHLELQGCKERNDELESTWKMDLYSHQIKSFDHQPSADYNQIFFEISDWFPFVEYFSEHKIDFSFHTLGAEIRTLSTFPSSCCLYVPVSCLE